MMFRQQAFDNICVHNDNAEYTELRVNTKTREISRIPCSKSITVTADTGSICQFFLDFELP